VDKTLLGVIEEVMVCFYGKESCGSKGFAKGSLSATFNRGEEEEGGNGGGGLVCHMEKSLGGPP
jgi:hypothetical protein